MLTSSMRSCYANGWQGLVLESPKLPVAAAYAIAAICTTPGRVEVLVACIMLGRFFSTSFMGLGPVRYHSAVLPGFLPGCLDMVATP